MILKDKGFYKGMNLGGWMSQCDYSEERLNGFITEKDFETIASWGFDHVRIPVDYNVLCTEEGEISGTGIARIGKALENCRRHGLRAVLDLHKTAGFSFDQNEGESGFFENEKYQEQFFRIWEALAGNFGGMSGSVAFELLNEVTEKEYLPAWKRISSECIRRIRLTAPDSLILLGSYHHNNVEAVADLDSPQDKNVIYNFHCYEPIRFTHQKAHWMDLPETVSYEESGATEAFFEELFAPAIRKAEEEGTALYCGEYGVIDQVEPSEALKWFRALHSVLEKYQIARSVWSFREMDFGIADARWDGLREELLTLL